MNPTVCAILLTADRPEMTKRTIRCFVAQTYKNKRLLIYDSSKRVSENYSYGFNDMSVLHHLVPPGRTIGALRNEANNAACELDVPYKPDIIVHFDSDDWSHPNRINEQVALLQASGADCVGYNEMLFWRICPRCRGFDDYCADVAPCETCHMKGGEAWLYSLPRSNYALGTSLAYKRSLWERKPFEDTSSGEDLRFITGVNIVSVSSLHQDGEPRMVASIHGGNTHCKISDQSNEPEHLRQWHRRSDWDCKLRAIMQ
jgi:glycosyltransferase involved in cell wall biosynthesis